MPKYHFNIDDGDASADFDGAELESLEVAKCEAVKMAGNMICDAAGEFWDRAEWTMTVSDDRGLTLFTLQFIGTESPALGSLALARPHAN